MTNNPRKFDRVRRVLEVPTAELRNGINKVTVQAAEIRQEQREQAQALQNLSIDVLSQNASIAERLSTEISNVLAEVRSRWQEEDELLQFLARRERANLLASRIDRDNTPATQVELNALRESSNYADAWELENPLISVRIASYLNTEALVTRAIPSILSQSYQNFEIIIVNDGPNPETRSAVSAFNDSRIRYEEFPARSTYPEDRHLRWMVAGSPGMNFGAELARGEWIAPLDDDDAFTPDRLARLLDFARSTRAEIVYGSIDQFHELTGETHKIFSDPPTIGQISMQAAMYHSGLRFMPYDTESWRVDEPGDWNLIRRMMDAGVTMAALDETVTAVHMIPYQHKTNL